MKNTFTLLLLLCIAFTLQAETIFIDFGKTGFQTTGNWNNFAPGDSFRFNSTDNDELMIENMIDSTGADTTVDMWFTSTVGGGNTSAGIGGVDTNVLTSTGMPISATRDVMFVTNGSAASNAIFELRDLVPNAGYNLTFFTGTADSREDSKWTIGTDSVTLNPTNNTSNTVTISNAQANASGVMEIIWEPTSVGNAALWNTLEITAVPEPSSLLLVAMAFAGLVFLRRR